MGMRICIADIGAARIDKALLEISKVKGASADQVAGLETDVSKPEDVARLHQFVRSRWGHVEVLMNNAGIQPGSSIFDQQGTWDRVLAVNLGGAVLGTREFVPAMLAAGKPGLVINSGSKQGITTPPGDPAYNVSKAGLKVFTEALQHELRNTPDCRISAHLLIPGFVFTELTAQGRSEKPPAAWTPEQTVDFMVERLNAGDFYILCPDNDIPRALDERRILWAASDLVENRPPLSRWHPDYAPAFAQFAQSTPSDPITKP